MNRAGVSTLIIPSGDDLHTPSQQQQLHENNQLTLHAQHSLQESPVDSDVAPRNSSGVFGFTSPAFIDTSRSLSSQRSTHIQYIATDSCEQYDQNNSKHYYCTETLMRRIGRLEVQVRTGFIVTCSLLTIIAIATLAFIIHNNTTTTSTNNNRHHTAVYKEQASIIQATSSRKSEDTTSNNATPTNEYMLCKQITNHYWSDQLGKCFIFHDQPKFFGDAKAACNSQNQMLAYPESEKELQILHQLTSKYRNSQPHFDIFVGFERYSTQNVFLSIDQRMLLSSLGIPVKYGNPTDSYCQISENRSIEIVGERLNRYFCTFNTDSISTRLVLVSISKSLHVL